VNRKTWVLDTSVLAQNKQAIHNFADQDVYIPMAVLEELDHLKQRSDLVGQNVRYVIKFLDRCRSKGSLKDGVYIENGQKITVIDSEWIPSGLEDTPDNRIIGVAARIGRATVLSRDINLRVKCDGLGVPAEEYNEYRESAKQDSGIVTVNVTQAELDEFFDMGKVIVPLEESYPNQCVLLKADKSGSALGMVEEDGAVYKLLYTQSRDFQIEKITPRNMEQTFALELLLDPEIPMVTLSGMAGTGKTFLTVAAMIHHLRERTYQRVILSRPNHSLSKEIGFLPGNKFEKMEPWVQPFFDNFKVILGKNGLHYVEQLMTREQIEVEALSFIRGRTMPRTLFVIDEAQNITRDEAKAVLTRMGEGSKIVLLGDLDQIDSSQVNQSNSGLAALVEKFKPCPYSGHITLTRGERSPLATYAAMIL
jgi:PhoH-like ATPase